MTESVNNQRVALITGAGQGIGFAICQRLFRAGYRIILNDLDPVLAEKASLGIDPSGSICLAVPGNAADMNVISTMVKEAQSRFGRLDAVVANAGITLFGDFLHYEPEDFRKVMDLNLGGSFFLAQQAAIAMKDYARGGSILFMSSVTGHQAHRELAAYGMTKAALEMLAKHLVVELSPYQITVNCLAPGATTTERTLHDPEYEATWSRITPMGRPGRPEDVAEAALFLLSDGARHITGQTLVIDGGWSSVSPSPYE